MTNKLIILFLSFSIQLLAMEQDDQFTQKSESAQEIPSLMQLASQRVKLSDPNFKKLPFDLQIPLIINLGTVKEVLSFLLINKNQITDRNYTQEISALIKKINSNVWDSFCKNEIRLRDLIITLQALIGTNERVQETIMNALSEKLTQNYLFSAIVYEYFTYAGLVEQVKKYLKPREYLADYYVIPLPKDKYDQFYITSKKVASNFSLDKQLIHSISLNLIHDAENRILEIIYQNSLVQSGLQNFNQRSQSRLTNQGGWIADFGSTEENIKLTQIEQEELKTIYDCLEKLKQFLQENFVDEAIMKRIAHLQRFIEAVLKADYGKLRILSGQLDSFHFDPRQ